MCLVAIAHAVSAEFPLVVAANRDEDYDRPTLAAAPWEEWPEVIGGRDVEAGGSWLAVRRTGRFAAVTNLRGAVRTSRSRGALVRDFVTSAVEARHYADAVLAEAAEFAGFHLIAGDESGEVYYVTQGLSRQLPQGVHAFSNAPAGEEWSKVAVAADAIGGALAGPAAGIAAALLSFLSTARGATAFQDEVFIAGERYGTRSSTVILVGAEEIAFTEQSWARGGRADGDPRTIRVRR